MFAVAFPRRAFVIASCSAEIVRQRIVDVGRRHRRMPGTNRDLMQVGHHIADRVQSLDAAALMRIDLDAADLVVTGAERRGKLGADVTSEHRIDNVEGLPAAIAQHRGHFAAMALERGRMG